MAAREWMGKQYKNSSSSPCCWNPSSSNNLIFSQARRFESSFQHLHPKKNGPPSYPPFSSKSSNNHNKIKMKRSLAVLITALAAFAAAAPIQDFYVIGEDGQIYARDALPQGRFGPAIKAAKTVVGGLGDKVLDLGKTTQQRLQRFSVRGD